MRTVSSALPQNTYTVQLGYNSSRSYFHEATFGSRAAAVRYFNMIELGYKYRIRLMTPSGRIAAREGASLTKRIPLGSVNVRGSNPKGVEYASI